MLCVVIALGLQQHFGTGKGEEEGEREEDKKEDEKIQ